jgi:hypothetical protein
MKCQIIKGSKLMHSGQSIKEYILFPYKQINEKHTIYVGNETTRQLSFGV